jgi:hypothetical protein
MTGASRSAAELAERVVRVEVGHVVSYGSMVTRAYFKNSCAGIVVEGSDLAPWLISSPSVLLPNLDELRLRAEAEKGIPFEHGEPRLMKIGLKWGDEFGAEIKVPSVVAGRLGTAAVSLSVPSSLRDKIGSESGPSFTRLTDDPVLELGDTIGVAVVTPEGPVVRWGRVASDPGFSGRPGGFALGVGLNSDEAGSPVYLFDDDGPHLCGLADPVDSTTARLLPPSALAETIAPPPAG